MRTPVKGPMLLTAAKTCKTAMQLEPRPIRAAHQRAALPVLPPAQRSALVHGESRSSKKETDFLSSWT